MTPTLPLSGLLEQLRAEGLGLGVGDHAAVQQLLSLESEWDLGRLRLVLRAALTRSREEQETFDRVFDAWRGEARPAGAVAVLESPASRSWWRGAWERQSVKGALVAAVVLLVVVGFGLAFSGEEGVDLTPTLVTDGEPESVSPGSEAAAGAVPSAPDGADDGISSEDRAEGGAAAAAVETNGGDQPIPLVEEPPSEQQDLLATAEEQPSNERAPFSATLALPAFGLAGLLLLVAVLVGFLRPVPGALPPPYTFHFVLKPRGPPPLPDSQLTEDLAAMLTVTSRREESRQLDLDRTVEATVAAAGAPTPVYERAPPSPRYAVLVDLEGGASAAWAEVLFRHLRRAGVRIEQYSYRGQPIFLEGQRNGRVTRLSELATRNFDALVVVGSSEGVLDPAREAAAAWVRELEHFPERAWFETRLPERWGWGARVLAEQASTPVLPFSLHTLRLARPGEEVLRPEDVTPPWPWICDRAPTSGLGLDLLEEWSGEAWPLLLALAALPEAGPAQVYWLAERFFPQIPASNVLRVLTVPWVSTRRWPEGLRPALAERLQQQRPALAEQLRLALEQELIAQEPAPGTGAHLRWELVKLAQHLQHDPESSAKELDRLRRGHVEATAIAERSEAFRSWAAHAGEGLSEREPRPWDWLWAVLVALVLSLGAARLWMGVEVLAPVIGAVLSGTLVLVLGWFLELGGFSLATVRGRAWVPRRKALGVLRLEGGAVLLVAVVGFFAWIEPTGQSLCAALTFVLRLPVLETWQGRGEEQLALYVVGLYIWLAIGWFLEDQRAPVRWGTTYEWSGDGFQRRRGLVVEGTRMDWMSDKVGLLPGLLAVSVNLLSTFLAEVPLGGGFFQPLGLAGGYVVLRILRELHGDSMRPQPVLPWGDRQLDVARVLHGRPLRQTRALQQCLVAMALLLAVMSAALAFVPPVVQEGEGQVDGLVEGSGHPFPSWAEGSAYLLLEGDYDDYSIVDERGRSLPQGELEPGRYDLAVERMGRRTLFIGVELPSDRTTALAWDEEVAKWRVEGASVETVREEEVPSEVELQSGLPTPGQLAEAVSDGMSTGTSGSVVPANVVDVRQPRTFDFTGSSEEGPVLEDPSARRAIEIDVGEATLGGFQPPTIDIRRTGNAPIALSDPEEIRESVGGALEAYSKQITHCYELRLSTDPDAAGSWELIFSIRTDGRTSNVEAFPMGESDPVLESCMVERASAWTFQPMAQTQNFAKPYTFGRGPGSSSRTGTPDTESPSTVKGESVQPNGSIGGTTPATGVEGGSSQSGAGETDIADPVSSGPSSTIPTTVVDIQIRNNKNIKACFLAHKKSTGELPAVTLRFTLEPDGHVSSASLREVAYQGTALESCLSGSIKMIEFPSFEGDAYTLNFPFRF